jgi:DNA repair protein RecO
MKQHKDHAIVLSRVDYGERDRILTLLCEEQGKVSVLAKGVRSEKSRLAGGIELLCESEVSFIDTRSSLKTLTGARLSVHFSGLSKEIRRMQQAFSYIKVLNGITEDGTGQEYYTTLLTAFMSLNDEAYDPRLVDIWFNLQILQLSGSAPNLRMETGEEAEMFEFNFDGQQFLSRESGAFNRNDLKLLRLCSTQAKPPKIQNQLGSEDRLQTLTRTLLKSNVTEV